MPRPAPQPLTGKNFRVDLGDGVARGFSEVILPRLSHAAVADGAALLTLRRAATGANDLYAWWDAARRTSSVEPRIVEVLLFTAEGIPALRWRFLGCRPVELGYSPLDAVAGGIVFETLALAFERVEMGDPPKPG